MQTKILLSDQCQSRLLFGRTNYNRPTRFINEINSDLLEYQGLARPANTSFKASYSSGDLTFGQGMSLAQALQDRKRSAAPRLFIKQSPIWSIYSWSKISF